MYPESLGVKDFRERRSRSPVTFVMAIQAPFLRGFISPLQFIAAFSMFITGIFDRALHIFPSSFIALPVWTGLLVSFVV